MKRSHSMAAALVASGALVTFMAVPVSAHHSFTQFDGSRSYVLDGTVTNFEWTNPHGWLWVKIPDGKGGMQLWGAETKAPAGLVRDGWTKRSFNPGDRIKLYIHPMKDGLSKTGEFVKAVLPGGRVLEPMGGSPNGPVRNPQPPPH